MANHKSKNHFWYSIINKGFFILFAISIIVIVIIVITEKHQWSDIFLQISYSILASCIIYLVTVILPNHIREERDIRISQPMFYTIVESLRLCIDAVKHFASIGEGAMTKEEFIAIWNKQDLQITSISTFGKTITEHIEVKMNLIHENIISLLSLRNLPEGYYDVIQEIYLSYVIQNKLQPDYFLESYNENNQQQFGESLYEVYRIVHSFYCENFK